MSEEAKTGEDTEKDARHWRRESERWMRAAAYLASCHAATLEHEGTFKSCSARSRERYVHICEIAADLLEGKPVARSMDEHDIEVRAAKRCREAVKEAKK